MNKKQRKMFIRIIITIVLIICLQFVNISNTTKFILYLIPYFIIGYDILLKAFKGIVNKQIFDENFLMAVATIGALALGLIYNGDYIEAVIVMLFYQIGELFQSYATRKSRKDINKLMDIRPDYANIEINGQIEKVDPETINIGDIIIVKGGEKIPIDGIIVEGKSSINTVALTGESLPRDVKVGDSVISGCINLFGVLKIKTTKSFCDSTVSKILDLVENASSRKSKSENFVSKFAKIYTPIVCLCALILAVIPPIINLIIGNDINLYLWLYRGLSFLVASCPCALVVSIPFTFFAGIGGASSKGILIKGSSFIESLSKTKYIIFDKTGTLTKGVFEVVAIHHNEFSKEKLLEIAATAESCSNHPISKSIIKAYNKEINYSRIHNSEEISGEGIIANVDDMAVAIGNNKLMERLNIEYKNCHRIGTIVHIAINNKYSGHIIIADIIKDSSKETINNLKKIGIKKTVMLTGDSYKVANEINQLLNIDEVYSDLLPNDKVNIVETILSKKEKKATLAFVGDGINDAPVLSRADIGIGMGAMGSDAAIEASDIVLMDDNPIKIIQAIKISKKCIRIVYENIIFSILIKVLALILIALGVANMWIAIFADVGVTVLAILNAIRALFNKNIK